jgi:uncharacterized membrane protein required for colicin V production
MVMADWIAIGVILVFALLGLIFGFGKTLKFFTGGVFGVIISVIVCYFLYGIVIHWTFTQDLMNKFVEVLTNADNGFCNFLIKIRAELVVTCIALFIIVQILRVIVVSIIKHVAEIDNPVFKTINKFLGMVVMIAVIVMFVLIAFQIISWVGGSTAEDFAQKLDGSVFGLDKVFANNPLITMIEFIRNGGK